MTLLTHIQLHLKFEVFFLVAMSQALDVLHNHQPVLGCHVRVLPDIG